MVARSRLLVIITLGVTLLTCSGALGAQPLPGRVHVTYWEKWTGFEKDAMQSVVDDFNRSQSQIWVDYTSISGVNEKTLIATAGGNPPDLAGLWAADIVDFADKGALLPLDEALRGSSIKQERYLPVYWNMGTYATQTEDGKLASRTYAVVAASSVLALHWNKDLFAQAGLDPDRPPRTLTELDAFAERLTRQTGGQLERIGFLPTEPGWWPYGWVAWFGGQPWDGGKQILIDSPEQLRAFHWLRGYSERYGVSALQNLSSSFGNYASAQNPFMSGKLAMVLQGVWLGDFMARYAPDLHWGAAPFPSEKATDAPVTLADADMLAIPRGARHPAEAFRFIEFVSRQTETEKVCLGQGKNSPLRNVSEAFFRNHRNPNIRMFQALANSSGAAAVPKLPIWHEYVSEVSNALSSTWVLEETPERALQRAQTRVQASWDRKRARVEARPARWLGLMPSLLTALLVIGVCVFSYREAARRRALRGGKDAARSNASLWKGVLFASPWLTGGVLFVIFPVLSALVYSFCDYSVLSAPRFIGLANFIELFQDDVFWLALKNTLIYAAFSVPLGLLAALSLALLLDAQVRASSVYRTLLFIPALLPTVASAMVWLWIYNGEYGVLNLLLKALSFGHLPNVAWLSDRRWAMPALIAMSVWGIGQMVVILAIALEGVQGALYEAAELDGAGVWNKLRHVTLPAISPVLYFNCIIGLTGALQVFVQPFVMTGGGPARATLSYAMRLYESGFSYLRMGYACAMAWLLFLLIAALTGLATWFGRTRVALHRELNASFGAPTRTTMAISDSAFAGVFRRYPRARVLVHLMLVIASLSFVFPFLWMLSTSLKSIEQTMVSPPVLLASPPKFHNYAEALHVIPFLTYTANSLTVCILSALGMTLSSALVAFSFTRLEWPGRDLVFGLTLATMMVPFPVLMIPLYGVFKTLGWVGTLRPLWAPAFFGGAFNIFLLRQFFLRIPKNFAEAMTLDGASELNIFVHAYLRLSAAPLAVVALMQAIYSWNDFLGPLLFLTDQHTFTLSLGLQFYQSQHGGTAWHYLMAASVMTTLPIVLVFFVVQKAFFRGLSVMKSVDG